MNDIINQAISEATLVAAPEPIETPQATEETVTPEATEPDDTPFPKKAVNALSRRDKQIGKLQAQLAADRAELAKFRESQVKSSVPSEESFDNYGEYLKAQHRMEWEQENANNSKQQEERKVTAEQEAWHAERTDYAIDKAKYAIENIPEYKQLFMEHADILQSLPPHVERAFYEAEEPALAFLALAKEGRLEALIDMSPYQAAREVGRAEIRGEALSKAKQITKTPAPIEGLKGTGSSSKSLETMNSQDLLKWLATK